MMTTQSPNEEYMYLQHSESLVAQMAATVFAAIVQRTELHENNEDELIERSVAIAVKLANRAEKRVQSDQEWVKKDNSSPYLIG